MFHVRRNSIPVAAIHCRGTNTRTRFGMLNKAKSSSHQKWNKCWRIMHGSKDTCRRRNTRTKNCHLQIEIKKHKHICGQKEFFFRTIVSVGRFIANERMQFPFSQKSCVVIKGNEKKFAIIGIQFVVRMRAARVYLSRQNVVSFQMQQRESLHQRYARTHGYRDEQKQAGNNKQQVFCLLPNCMAVQCFFDRLFG